MECNHISKVLEWGVDDSIEANLKVTLWGCTMCELEATEPFNHADELLHEHEVYVEGCFACKVQTLQLSTGDANGSLVANGWTNKKWQKEINEYRNAKAQGIQPTGTSLSKVRAAVDQSNKTGVAFGSKES